MGEYFNNYSKPANKFRGKKFQYWVDTNSVPTLSGLQASLVSCYHALEVVILSLKDLKVTKIVNYLSSGID